MNYTLTPSLEHIALVKIATTLWNQDDIRAFMAPQFYFPLLVSERREKWQDTEDKVVEKVSRLPVSLKEEILGFIKPVGLQILKWMEYHRDLLNGGYVKRNLSRLFWTPQGTVNKKKTAEILIKDESLDITKRYKLACIYCLEDDVPELWNKIPENNRKYFYNEEDPYKVRQQGLVVFWTYHIKGELAKIINMNERIWQSKFSPYQVAFEYFALDGNKAATEYFLQKLIPKERKESLVRFAGYVANTRYYCFRNRTDLPKDYADVLCFLLSQMDEEQQIEVFKSYPYKVLTCLLDWPWQSLFMETANRVWDFLSEEGYDLLLRIIVDKVIDGYMDYNYQKLFGEFWKQSSDAYKKYVIGRCTSSGFLLSDLFEIGDKENVRLILKNATVKEKEEIIFCYKGKNICESLIYSNKWVSLKFFVQECLSSKDITIKFKEEFKERIIRHRSEETLEKEKVMWDKCFQLLDNLAQENNKKRSIGEGENSPIKRLCSIEFKEVGHNMKK